VLSAEFSTRYGWLCQSTVGSQKSERIFFERCETTVEFLNIEQCEMIEC